MKSTSERRRVLRADSEETNEGGWMFACRIGLMVLVALSPGAASSQPPENVYVESVRLNGTTLDRCFITHEEVVAGGELLFVMSDRPNRDWATDVEQRPYSMSR
jgi:hypothetical protein